MPVVKGESLLEDQAKINYFFKDLKKKYFI
jgi:hypothetical protein